MIKIIILGSGLIAEVAYFYFTNDSEHQIVSFTNGKEFINQPTFLGLPLVPFEEVEEYYPPGDYSLFIAIGYTKRNKIRAQRYLHPDFGNKRGQNSKRIDMVFGFFPI